MNSNGNKIKYFFHTTMMTKDMFKWKKENEENDEEKQFEAFSKTIKSEFIKDPEMKNLKDLEMEFFPIIAHEHYYLVVFNFLKGNTVIIDNSETKMTYEAKYKTVCELLWKKENGENDEEKQFEAFSKTIKSEFIKDPEMKNLKDLEMEFFPIIAHEHYYLVVFNFLKGNTVIIDNSETKMTYEAKYKTAVNCWPKWGTNENDTDCEIFLMMHIEYYNGETAKN
nr:hypothetical protein [Tanacetum cinerariifolium]